MKSVESFIDAKQSLAQPPSARLGANLLPSTVVTARPMINLSHYNRLL